MFLNRLHPATVRALILLSGAVFGTQGVARANCGMDVCPMHAEDDAPTSPLRPIVSVRYTTVATDAAVLETTAGALYQVSEPIQVGVLVPMVSVSQFGERTTGLGNIVTFVNGTILPAPQTVVLNAGLQLEVPTVSDPALGDGHFLLMPTLQAGWHPGNGIVMATVGWGRVLDGAHNHDHDAHGHGGHDHGDHGHDAAESAPGSIVNPHASSEPCFASTAVHTSASTTAACGSRRDWTASKSCRAMKGRVSCSMRDRRWAWWASDSRRRCTA